MKWFRNQSVKTKLTAAILALLLVLFGPLLTYNVYQLHSLSLAKGELSAAQSVKVTSEVLQVNMNRIGATLSTLADVFADASKNGSFTREDGIRMLGAELQKQPDIVALYTLWEPQAFDGQDAENSYKHSYDDATGRYLPYVSRNSDQIRVDPLEDYATPGVGDYYLVPKSTLKTYWSDPYLYPVNGKSILISSMVVPILDKNGAFAGIMGADFSLEHLQQVTQSIDAYGGYGAILSQNGQYITNGRYPDEVQTEFSSRPDLAKIWDKVLQGQYTHYSLDRDGASIIRIFSPITIVGSDNHMYLQVVAYKSAVLADYSDTMRNTILLASVIMLVLCGMMYLLVHITVREIGKINALALKLSQGDFTDRLDVLSNDEFGSLNARLNEMMGTLRHTIKTVSDHALSIGATSQQLTASAEQTGQAAETITLSIQNVAEGSETQRVDAQEMARTMDELAAGISRMADSASALSEASGHIDEQTRLGNGHIQSAARQMETVSETVAQTRQIIEQLHTKSESISRFVGMITGISAQTNILALNAAIEASRAGEQGRGFAVVAEEVRKLAEQTRGAAEQIAGLAGEIRTEAATASAAMEQGVVETGRGAETVQHSGRIFASIMQEMAEVNTQLGELSASAEQMAASVEEVTASATQMQHIAEQSASNAHNVAAASEQQLATMEEVTAAAASLSHMVEELVELMSKFKT